MGIQANFNEFTAGTSFKVVVRTTNRSESSTYFRFIGLGMEGRAVGVDVRAIGIGPSSSRRGRSGGGMDVRYWTQTCDEFSQPAKFRRSTESRCEIGVWDKPDNESAESECWSIRNRFGSPSKKLNRFA